MILDPRLTISALTLIIVTVFFLVASGRVHADAFASTTPGIEASGRLENQTILPLTPHSHAESLKPPERETPPTTASQAESGTEEQEPPTLFSGYWQQGLFIENPNHHFEMKIGGKIMADAGYIELLWTQDSAAPTVMEPKVGAVVFSVMRMVPVLTIRIRNCLFPIRCTRECNA